MGQSSGTETVTQNSEPWSQAQPYLSDIFRQSQNLYRQGAEFYPGSTVVPFSPDTQAGMQGLRNQFTQSPVGYDQAVSTVSNVAGQGGVNNPFVQNIQNAGAQQTTAGRGVFQDMTQAPGNNPFLDARFDQAAERVRDNTAAMFSKAGRYGSVAHQDQLSDSLGDMATNFYGNAYESDQNRRMQAAGQLAAMQSGDISRNLGAQQAAAGVGQGATSQALQAAQMFPGLYDYGQAGSRGLIGLGQMQEAKAGEQLQDSINRFNFGQNAGWDLLNRYNQVVQPIAGLGRSSTGTQPSNQPSTLQTLGGLGLAAAGIFSDRRLKTDVEKVGEKGGFDWYSFRYVWDAPETRHEGVMAQDVEQVRPDAVTADENGLRNVNYGALGLEPLLFVEGEARS